MNVKQLKPVLLNILLVLLLVFPITLPFFHSTFFHMHDNTHTARLVELDRALKAGNIPSRWSDNFGWGYGMPLLHFYAPLFYYGAEVFYLIGLSAILSIKLMTFICLLIGMVGAYKLGKSFFGTWGGYITAVAFTYAPYRAVQLYVRGALSELLATSFLPFAFWAIYKFLEHTKDRKKYAYIIPLALSLTGIFLSHNVITLLSIPMLGLWTLFWSVYFILKMKEKINYTSVMIKGLVSIVLAFALSAWFLIPAYFEKDYTIVDTISGGYSFYKLHFVYLRQFLDPTFKYGGSILGPGDDISFQLGIPQFVLLLISGIYFGYLLLKRRLESTVSTISVLISLTLLAISVFIMVHHSDFIWEMLPIIHIVQFPWRFLSFAILFIGILIGLLGKIDLAKPKLEMVLKGLIIACLIIGNISFFKPENYLMTNELYSTDDIHIQTKLSDTLKDYLPKTAKEIKPGQIPELLLNGQEYKPDDLVKRNGYRSFHVDSQSGGEMQNATYDFIGWTIKVDHQSISHRPDQKHGLITFNVPPGPHFVEIKLEKTNMQRWSDRLSLISWLGLGAYLLFQRSKYRKTGS